MSSVEARLSPREREVLSLLEAGATNRGQAVALARHAREHGVAASP